MNAGAADMKTLIKSVIVSAILLAGAAAPALAQTPSTYNAGQTVMIDGKGATVDNLNLRWRFDATWVIDNKRILMRDAHRDNYLITLKEDCKKLEMDRNFVVFPELKGRVYSSLKYEVRDKAGPYCTIGSIEQVKPEAAASLRAEIPKQG
jgi:hypothetical protein